MHKRLHEEINEAEVPEVKKQRCDDALTGAAAVVRKYNADNYYGERDAADLLHGRGVRLSPEGKILEQQCGEWDRDHGKHIKAGWVVTRKLPANTPLSQRVATTDAINEVSFYYYYGRMDYSDGSPFCRPRGLCCCRCCLRARQWWWCCRN
jgi:hypothetical protein